jgi:hypothetical protein
MLAHGFTLSAGPERYRPEDHQHYPPLLSPDGTFAIELHTRLVWDQGRDPVPAGLLLDGAQPATPQRPATLVPRLGHRIAHLIAHAQTGDRNYAAGQIVLKDMADLVMLSQRAPDWVDVERLFRATGTLREMQGFLAAAAMILGDSGAAIPACKAGEAWARRAVAALAAPGLSRNRLLLHLAADYMRRVAREPAKLALVVRTLTDPGRRADFLGTQYRRWRR